MGKKKKKLIKPDEYSFFVKSLGEHYSIEGKKNLNDLTKELLVKYSFYMNNDYSPAVAKKNSDGSISLIVFSMGNEGSSND